MIKGLLGGRFGQWNMTRRHQVGRPLPSGNGRPKAGTNNLEYEQMSREAMMKELGKGARGRSWDSEIQKWTFYNARVPKPSSVPNSPANSCRGLGQRAFNIIRMLLFPSRLLWHSGSPGLGLAQDGCSILVFSKSRSLPPIPFPCEFLRGLGR